MKIKKPIITLLFFIAPVSTLFSQEVKEKKADFYTDIAASSQTVDLSREMEIIPPVSLDMEDILPWNNKKRDISTSVKIKTPKQLQDSLTVIRDKYRLFLTDLAPIQKETRLRQRVDKMHFRYETAEDRQNFDLLLDGKGVWSSVDMPVYHGPQGLSTAWYRTEIDIDKEMFDMSALKIHFNGSDYYTDAFINGHHVGSHEGMLDEFEFDIKPYAKEGSNILLVKVRNDYSMLGGEGEPRRWGNKLSASNCPGWDDPFSGWSCCPTGYGIYQDVYIVGQSEPAISSLFCRPLLNEKAVELWVEVDLSDGENADDFVLKYSLFGQNFEAKIVENQKKKISVVGGRVLQKIKIGIEDDLLKIWEPNTPWLYQMQVSLYSKDEKRRLDYVKQQFGMREFVIDAHSTPKGRMYLNGKEIRLRGANTMGFLQQRVMAHDWDGLIDDLLLAKLTNMNFIRTTQRVAQREVYEYADRLGVMMQADLPLFAYINQKQYPEVLSQAVGIERLLRNHPSVIMMSYLNEPMAEKKPHAISRYAYERLFDALDIVVLNENPDRAVKYVDGDYQAPSNGYPDNHCYNVWYNNHGISIDQMCRGAWLPISKGWMYGCGEFGAEGLDPVELMSREYPKEWLKREADGSWSPKYMNGIYSGVQTYDRHWEWFETEYTPEDWVAASHEHQRWGVDRVARAFRRMPRMNSFAVHLFIDAWPNGWVKAIMDCERTPKTAWYAYRDALSPLAVQIESERAAFYSEEQLMLPVWICNDMQNEPTCRLEYVIEHKNRVVKSGYVDARIPSVTEGSQFQGFISAAIPKVNKRSELTVKVSLVNIEDNRAIHSDEIALSIHPKQPTTNQRVFIIGESDDVKSIVTSLGIKNILHKGEILLSNLIIVSSDKMVDSTLISQINLSVSRGATAIILRDALESEAIQNRFNFDVTSKDQSWILFRNRDHNWIKEVGARDLFYPYSYSESSPKMYDFITMEGGDFRDVLDYKNRAVISEKEVGNGRLILCGLSLEGALESNPSLVNIIKNILSER